jgi:hypothetical protein
MSMLLADVLHTLVHTANAPEATKHDLTDAINEHFKDDLDALDDKAKESRPAPVDRRGAISLSPAAVMTQKDVDDAVAKALTAQDAQQTARFNAFVEQMQAQRDKDITAAVQQALASQKSSGTGT